MIQLCAMFDIKFPTPEKATKVTIYDHFKTMGGGRGEEPTITCSTFHIASSSPNIQTKARNRMLRSKIISSMVEVVYQYESNFILDQMEMKLLTFCPPPNCSDPLGY